MSFVRADPVLNAPRMGELQRRLADELRQPNPAANVQPIIRVEPAHGDITRVFVFWDEWGAMPQRDRSEVILGAWEAVHGADAALKVSVAMGLTMAEARQMRMVDPAVP